MGIFGVLYYFGMIIDKNGKNYPSHCWQPPTRPVVSLQMVKTITCGETTKGIRSKRPNRWKLFAVISMKYMINLNIFNLKISNPYQTFCFVFHISLPLGFSKWTRSVKRAWCATIPKLHSRILHHKDKQSLMSLISLQHYYSTAMKTYSILCLGDVIDAMENKITPTGDILPCHQVIFGVTLFQDNYDACKFIKGSLIHPYSEIYRRYRFYDLTYRNKLCGWNGIFQAKIYHRTKGFQIDKYFD